MISAARTSARLLVWVAVALVFGAVLAAPRSTAPARPAGANSESACDRSRGPELFLTKHESKATVRKIGSDQRFSSWTSGTERLIPPERESFAVHGGRDTALVVTVAFAFHGRAPPA